VPRAAFNDSTIFRPTGEGQRIFQRGHKKRREPPMLPVCGIVRPICYPTRYRSIDDAGFDDGDADFKCLHLARQCFAQPRRGPPGCVVMSEWRVVMRPATEGTLRCTRSGVSACAALTECLCHVLGDLNGGRGRTARLAHQHRTPALLTGTLFGNWRCGPYDSTASVGSARKHMAPRQVLTAVTIEHRS
jgi:hypothetical protein